MPEMITKIKTNTKKRSVCDVNIAPIKFATLWANYPEETPYIDPKTGNAPEGYGNQCSIKVSVALHKSGVEMKSFTAANVDVEPGMTIGRILLNGKFTATRANELSSWLKRQPFCGLPKKVEVITGQDWEKKISGRTGIIYFEDYWQRSTDNKNHPTGDHIDLWSVSRLTASGFRGTITTFARFTMGFSRIPVLYSDLNNSTQILFWEVK